MAHDDGASHRELGDADVILVGVSRSGKTPTSLYLALQFGVKAANYPLIPEDFARGELPEALRAFKPKLYGLTIAPERLQEIRRERRPGSQYADPENCRYEIAQAEALMTPRGHPLDQFNRQVDRGNRHHHPARAQARAARLLNSEGASSGVPSRTEPSDPARPIHRSRSRLPRDVERLRAARHRDRDLERARAPPSASLTPCPSAPKIQPTRPDRSACASAMPPRATVQATVPPN